MAKYALISFFTIILNFFFLDNQEDTGDYQQDGYIDVTVEPSDVTLNRGETTSLTCHVKGTEQYTVTWGKYAPNTSLPDYTRVRILNK